MNHETQIIILSLFLSFSQTKMPQIRKRNNFLKSVHELNVSKFYFSTILSLRRNFASNKSKVDFKVHDDFLQTYCY
jgi:hypothetical protein